MRGFFRLVAIAGIGAAVAGCGSSDGSALQAAVAPTTSASVATQASTTAVTTTAVTTTAPATTVATAAIEAKITKAYNDNRTFVPRASIDQLKVAVADATATFNVTPGPSSLGPESKWIGGFSNDALAVTGQSAVVAAKVTFADNVEIKRVVVHSFHAFPLTAGGTRTEIAATIALDRATAAKFDYEALKASVPKNSRDFFCGADAFRLHVVVWTNIGDKGCLTGPSKGTV